MDVLYTIKYKVGADTELSAHRDQLYVYAQKAFDVTPEQHRRYMAIVHEEKVIFVSFTHYFIIIFEWYNFTIISRFDNINFYREVVHYSLQLLSLTKSSIK